MVTVRFDWLSQPLNKNLKIQILPNSLFFSARYFFKEIKGTVFELQHIASFFKAKVFLCYNKNTVNILNLLKIINEIEISGDHPLNAHAKFT